MCSNPLPLGPPQFSFNHPMGPHVLLLVLLLLVLLLIILLHATIIITIISLAVSPCWSARRPAGRCGWPAAPSTPMLYMYACMHVCMYACMFICLHNMYVYIYIYIYIYIYTCIYIYVYIYTSYTYTHVLHFQRRPEQGRRPMYILIG